MEEEEAAEEEMRVEIAEKPEHWRAIDGFLSVERAGELRGVFDARMEDPLRVDPERFVWDYLHVPNRVRRFLRRRGGLFRRDAVS